MTINPAELLKTVCETKPAHEGIQREAIDAIFQAHDVIAELYQTIDSSDLRASVSTYMAHDPMIAKVEEAVSAQYEIIMAEDSGDKDRELAAARVGEGMEYWRKLIRKKMGKLG